VLGRKSWRDSRILFGGLNVVGRKEQREHNNEYLEQTLWSRIKAGDTREPDASTDTSKVATFAGRTDKHGADNERINAPDAPI